MKISFKDKKFLIIFITIDFIITLVILFFILKNYILVEKEPLSLSENNFRIEKVLDVSCKKDSDCETPYEYLIRSSCPFASKCIENKCNVICPDF